MIDPVLDDSSDATEYGALLVRYSCILVGLFFVAFGCGYFPAVRFHYAVTVPATNAMTFAADFRNIMWLNTCSFFIILISPAVLGLPAIAILVQTGFLLGAMTGRVGLSDGAWAIVPHGVVELASFTLCSATTFTLVHVILRAGSMDLKLRMLLRTLQNQAVAYALLVGAALIEAGVTPRLIHMHLVR